MNFYIIFSAILSLVLFVLLFCKIWNTCNRIKLLQKKIFEENNYAAKEKDRNYPSTGFLVLICTIVGALIIAGILTTVFKSNIPF